MKQFSFRHKVLMLAIAIVMASQLLTLFPVLDAIKRDVDERARQTVRLAGVLFDEYMHNRADQLLTTVNVLVVGLRLQAGGGGRRSRDDPLGARSITRAACARRSRCCSTSTARVVVSSTDANLPRTDRASRRCRRARRSRA